MAAKSLLAKTQHRNNGLTSSVSSLTSDESDEDCWRTKNYEDALQLAGFGKFQYILTLLCGWANASDAVEILCVSFILPSAGCDMNLSSTQKGVLGSSMFAGMMIGGYLWGYLADKNGRRQILMMSLAFNAICALISSISQVYWLFLLFRFLSGVGVGGSVPVIFSYFAEFQPKQHRGKMISFVAFFWMCGNIVAAALAWIVIPRTDFGYVSEDPDSFQYPSWRLFIALCALPSITSVFSFYILPESPKFLITKGKERQALSILATVYHINNKSPRTRYPVQSILLDNYELVERDSNVERSTGHIPLVTKIKLYFTDLGIKLSNILNDTWGLFERPLTRRSVILVVQMFTLSFGYYGLWMWLPQLLNRMQKYGGSACSAPSNYSAVENDCNPDGTANVDDKVYQQSFLTSLSNLPGNILTIAIIDLVGRKSLLVSSMVISGLSVLFIWCLKTQLQTLIMMCVFGGISVIGWNVLDVINVELYPTEKRSLAIGFITLIGRIASILANLAFGALIDSHCEVPILLVAAFMVSGGVLAVFLPNMHKKPLL